MRRRKRERNPLPAGVAGGARSGDRVLFILLTFAIPLAFLGQHLVQLYPFVDDVSWERSYGDDWLTFDRFAKSILHDGVLLPAAPGNYARPGGILYSFFVAAIYRVSGENPSFVYVAQGLLLGCAAVAMGWAFRRYHTDRSALIVLVLLAVYAYLDVSRWYTKKLLSENLLIALIPWFYLVLIGAWEERSRIRMVLAGCLLGLCVLARPNVLLAGPAIAIVILLFLRNRRKEAVALTGLFLAGFVLAQTPLFARNVIVTGGEISAGTFSPAFAFTRDWLPGNQRSIAGPAETRRPPAWRRYLDRSLYSAGITEYGIVWRWVIMNLMVLALIVLSVKQRRIEFWEAALLAFAVAYLLPIVPLGGIRTYGVRMILPAIPTLLVLAFRGLVRAWEEIAGR